MLLYIENSKSFGRFVLIFQCLYYRQLERDLLSKFTVEERKYLKQLVQEAIVRRFTNKEAVAHIKKELHKNITIKQITRIKKDIKNEASGLDK